MWEDRHLAEMCRSQGSRSQWVQRSDEDENSGDRVATVFTLGGNPIRPIVVKVLVNGTPLTVELDMGAAVSLVSGSVWKRVKGPS